VDKPNFCLSNYFPGDKSGEWKFLDSNSLLTYLFLVGLRKRRLGDRQHILTTARSIILPEARFNTAFRTSPLRFAHELAINGA
jgi:hypothetical protein